MSGIVQPPAPPSDYPYSDLFPEIFTFPPENHDGPLGNYSGGDPLSDHPAYTLIEGLRNRYYVFAQQEADNDWIRTEETSQGKIATLLQVYITECIAKGYSNLIEKDLAPTEAIEAIRGYINMQDEEVSNTYEDSLDRWSVELAKLDRGNEEPVPEEINDIPVIRSNDLLLALGKTPVSPEVEREERKAFCEETIVTLRHRIARVKFEVLSAIAISGLLARNISAGA